MIKFLNRHINIIAIYILLTIIIAVYFFYTTGLEYMLICEDIRSWPCFLKKISSNNEPVNIWSILVGAISLFGLYLLYIRTKDQIEKTKDQVQRTKLETERRLDERFDSAVNALSRPLTSDSYPSHLGAISSLTRLAIDSPENTQKCLDVLCSCNEWMEDYLDNFSVNYSKRTIRKYKSLMVDYIMTVTEGKDYSDRVDLTLEYLDKSKLDYEYPFVPPDKEVELYPYQRLTEENRIASTPKGEKKVSMLAEKRSQAVLRAVKELLIMLSNQKKKKLNFKYKFLCGIDLSNWPAKDSKKYVNLDDIDFSHSYLNGSFVFNLQIKGANLRSADMSGAMLFLSNAYRTNFHSVKLTDAFLLKINLESAELSHAEMNRSFIHMCNLQGANLRHAILDMSAILDSQMAGIDLSYAQMMFINFIHKKKVGRIKLQLQGANLLGASLQGAILNDVDMRGANLSGANLLGTDFEFTNLSYSIIINPIQLQGANIQKANLEGLVFYDEFLSQKFFLNKSEEDKAISRRIPMLTAGRTDIYSDHIKDTWRIIEKPNYLDKIKNLILDKGINSMDYKPEQIKILKEEWLKLCLNNMYVAGRLLHLLEILYKMENYDHEFKALMRDCQNYIYEELKKQGKINDVRPPLSDDTNN